MVKANGHSALGDLLNQLVELIKLCSADVDFPVVELVLARLDPSRFHVAIVSGELRVENIQVSVHDVHDFRNRVVQRPLHTLGLCDLAIGLEVIYLPPLLTGLANISAQAREGLKCVVALKVIGDKVSEPRVQAIFALLVGCEGLDCGQGINCLIPWLVTGDDRTIQPFGNKESVRGKRSKDLLNLPASICWCAHG